MKIYLCFIGIIAASNNSLHINYENGVVSVICPYKPSITTIANQHGSHTTIITKNKEKIYVVNGVVSFANDWDNICRNSLLESENAQEHIISFGEECNNERKKIIDKLRLAEEKKQSASRLAYENWEKICNNTKVTLNRFVEANLTKIKHKKKSEQQKCSKWAEMFNDREKYTLTIGQSDGICILSILVVIFLIYIGLFF